IGQFAIGMGCDGAGEEFREVRRALVFRTPAGQLVALFGEREDRSLAQFGNVEVTAAAWIGVIAERLAGTNPPGGIAGALGSTVKGGEDCGPIGVPTHLADNFA